MITTTNVTSSQDTNEGFPWYFILIIVISSLLLILGVAWTTISIKFPHAFPWAKASTNQPDYRIIRVPLLRTATATPTV